MSPAAVQQGHQLCMAKHAEWVVQSLRCVVDLQLERYSGPAKEFRAYQTLSQGLSGTELEAAWHLIRCLLHPDQKQRLTVQQAVVADFLM